MLITNKLFHKLLFFTGFSKKIPLKIICLQFFHLKMPVFFFNSFHTDVDADAVNNLNEDVRNIFLGQCATPYLGEPEDGAATIAFLASNDARYITGQTIVVDGGLTVHNPTVALSLDDRITYYR